MKNDPDKNPAWPFDVVLTPYTTREGKHECGFWVRDDLREELIALLDQHDSDRDVEKVGRILKDRGLEVAIQQWTWQEAEMNKRFFDKGDYPDVTMAQLMSEMVRHPLKRVE